jgi:Family of unknown function (DUF6152)
MRDTLVTASAVMATLLTCSGSIFAHHGMTEYDFQRRITLKGTVTRFDFVNPHVLLYIDVKDARGKVVGWIAETGSPNMMSRGGWNKSTLKAGDQITISGHPARDGSPTMRFVNVVLPNGQALDPASGFR